MRKDSQDEEWDHFAEGISKMLTEAGMVTYGKRKMVRATHTWRKQQDVQTAFTKLCEAENQLIDDMQNQELITQMNTAKKEFETIRYVKEQEAWNKIRNRMGANESKKLLHVLLPSDRTNMNLLDIQHSDSSPCTKQEAVEVMVEHYADVCSLPDHPSFNKKKKKEVEEEITNIEQKIDEEADDDDDIIISEETIANICKSLNMHSAPGPDDGPPILLIEGGKPLYSFLAHFFTALIHRGYSPSSYRIAHIFPIFKGERNSCLLPPHQPH